MSAEPTDIRPRKMLTLAEQKLEKSERRLEIAQNPDEPGRRDEWLQKAQIEALQSIAASLILIARSEAQR